MAQNPYYGQKNSYPTNPNYSAPAYADAPMDGETTTNNTIQYPNIETTNAGSATETNNDGKSSCLTKKMIIIIAVVCVIVLTGAIVGIVFGTKAAKAAGKVTIVIQSANTKEKWLDSVIDDFNNDKIKTDDGKGIVIEVHHTGSTLKSELKPNIWSPQNKAFIEIQSRQDGITYVSDINQLCPDTTDIPVGVAIWRNMAQALGWPNQDIGFKDLGNLAVNPNGWGSISSSLSGFGDFKYGHGHPNSSNSGRLSVMATMMAFSNSTVLNTQNDIDIAANDPDVQAIVQSVVHLGKIDTDLLAKMRDHGISYLHAVANYESNVINWNIDYSQKISSHGFGGWVFIYLADGTFWMNHPLCVIDNSAYSTPEQIDAAKKFAEYATSQDKLKKLLQYGIRPTLTAQIPDITCCGSTITLANGADPRKSLENIDLLTYPDDNIVENVISTWNDIKKPAAFSIVVDTSGSMVKTDGYPFNRLYYAKQALINFVENTNDRDYLLLRGFGSVQFSTPGFKANISDSALNWINTLLPNGNTPLYQTMQDAWQELNNLKTQNEMNGTDWNYAIIALTDGVPDDITLYNNFYTSPISYPSTVELSTDSNIIHIFPIIFGSEGLSEKPNLERLASISGGKYFEGNNDDISDIYFQLSLQI